MPNLLLVCSIHDIAFVFNQPASHHVLISTTMSILPISNVLSRPTAEPPKISTEPEDQIDVFGRATFSVQVRGTLPFSYSWKCNLADGSKWQHVSSRGSGVDTDTLVLNNVEKGDEGNYRCVIGNFAGSINSKSAKLTLGMLNK